MINEAEVALLVRVCRDHEVAFCDSCQKAIRLDELSSDIVGGRRFNRCRGCQQDVEASVRAHLHNCSLIKAERALEQYGILVKETNQLIDASHAHIAESQERIQYRLNAGICMACRKVIQPGQGRYHYPAGDFHVHCFQAHLRGDGPAEEKEPSA